MRRALVCMTLGSILVLTATAHAQGGEPTPTSTSTPGQSSAPPLVVGAAAEPSQSSGVRPTTGAPTVELHASDQRAVIERRTGTSSPSGFAFSDVSFFSVGHWEQSCVAPCQLKLDPRFSYRVSGDGLVPTDSFTLPQGRDRVRLDARMGSSTGRLAGIFLTRAGAVGATMGGIALGISPILESEDVGSKGFRTFMVAGGATFLAVGLVSVAIGLYLWTSNGSSVQQEGAGVTIGKSNVRLTPSGIAF